MSSDPQHAESLSGQVALLLAAQLSRATESMPHDISERLRFARERAMAIALQQRHAAQPQAAAAVVVAGRSAALGGGPSLWLRLASALPLLVLAAGLIFIQQYYESQQISAAAEIDSALLADDLPPAAYGDPGFVEYLRTTDAP